MRPTKYKKGPKEEKPEANDLFLLDLANQTIGKIKDPYPEDNPEHTNHIRFKDYQIPKEDFDKLLFIVHRGMRLILPIINSQGYIIGYQIRQIQLKNYIKSTTHTTIFVVAFSAEQVLHDQDETDLIKKDQNRKNLFNLLCRSNYNLNLLNIAVKKVIKKEEGRREEIKFEIKEKIEDYRIDI